MAFIGRISAKSGLAGQDSARKGLGEEADNLRPGQRLLVQMNKEFEDFRRPGGEPGMLMWREVELLVWREAWNTTDAKKASELLAWRDKWNRLFNLPDI